MRRVVGVNGDAHFEAWCASNVAMCIVTTKAKPEITKHLMIQHFRKLGIEPQALSVPAVPHDLDVDGVTAFAYPEWELAFTKEMRNAYNTKRLQRLFALHIFVPFDSVQGHQENGHGLWRKMRSQHLILLQALLQRC